MDSLRDGMTGLKPLLGFLPDNITGLLLLGIAAAAALFLHRIYQHVLRKFLAERLPFVAAMLNHTQGVTQLAALIVAFTVVLPVAPFDPATSHIIARLIVISIIGLVGWAAITALHMGADIYVDRLRRDDTNNEHVRKHVTQVRVLSRAADTLILVVTVAAALMTFESVRQYGISLFASAGVAGIVAGFAARPLLSNLFAGVQLGVSQPVRIDDAVTVEGETGSVEAITSSYVVIRLWDWRRMVVPLAYFIEKPFVNWTRDDSSLIGTVMLYLDFSAPIALIREKARELAKASGYWNGDVLSVQVTDAFERSIEVRITASATSTNAAWDLRCDLREKLIDFLQREHPDALPRAGMQKYDSETPGTRTVTPPSAPTRSKRPRGSKASA